MTWSSSRGVPALAPAKVTLPLVNRTLPRERLFALLDEAWTKPVTWITAPAGAGKTTLAAGYFADRKRCALWYQVDERDGYPEDFFHYMRCALRTLSPRSKGAPPPLSAEYQHALAAFSTLFFEKLFEYMPPQASAVLDNYHLLPEASAMHRLIVCGIEMLPPARRIIIISRNEPPPAYARLCAHGEVFFVRNSDMRFTFDEFRALASEKRLGGSLAGYRRLYDKTAGWAAGMVMLTATLAQESLKAQDCDRLPEEILFHYFAEEVFGQDDKETQELLCQASFFPTMSRRVLEKLTGRTDSGSLLSRLHRNNYFVEKHQAAEPVYQFHPLFKEFLQAKAREFYREGEVKALEERAASILEEAHAFEDAASLFIGAGRWEALAGLVRRKAEHLASQGRFGLLEEWIGHIPPELREKEPWLMYWLGISHFYRNPGESRLLLEQAFHLFEQEGNLEGQFLSWTRVVEAIVCEWLDFSLLDHWIRWLEEKLKGLHGALPENLEIHVAASMVHALTHRQQGHPEALTWCERTLLWAAKTSDPLLHLKACIYVAQFSTFAGDRLRNSLALDEIRRISRVPGISPLGLLQGALMETASQFWALEDIDGAVSAADRGLALAEEHSIHLMDSIFILLKAQAYLTRNLTGPAGECLERLSHSAAELGQTSCLYHQLKAWYHFLLRQSIQSLYHGQTARALASRFGAPFAEFVSLHVVAQALMAEKNFDEALQVLEELGALAEKSGSPLFQFTSFMAKAYGALLQGRKDEMADFLRKALERGCRYSYYNLFWWWDGEAVSRLCAKSLELGIEVDYVKRLITCREVQPPRDVLFHEYWPWQLAVHGLGSFLLCSKGIPVSLSAQRRHKPLALLKIIVIAGRRGISDGDVIDLLWPDAEGDRGAQSLKFTLHQLRNLVGHEAVRLSGGRMFLNPAVCWTDLACFEELNGRAESLWRADATRHEGAAMYERLCALYRGDLFVDDEKNDWVIPARERLRGQYVLIVTRLGEFYEKQKLWEKALSCYSGALESGVKEGAFVRGRARCRRRISGACPGAGAELAAPVSK